MKYLLALRCAGLLALLAVRAPGASAGGAGVLHFPAPAAVRLEGVLGRALAANRNGRLEDFVRDETSPPIALFARETAAKNREGDWYGEHAGKWLYAAARAADRTGDAALRERVRRVADYLVSVQEPDGYLGTYAPERRFTRREALGQRTWDVWVHSYLVIGLLEVNRFFPDSRYLNAARKIGDLLWTTLTDGKLDITDLGNHLGLSATIALEPAVDLYTATGDRKYLELARLIAAQADRRTGLEFLARSVGAEDVAAIGDGKSYQLCWTYVGLAKLHRATGEPRYLQATLNAWENIRQHHLTLGGGPWGGVGLKSRELFNAQEVFSPYGYVETCSTFAWIALNRELLRTTGEARFADEIEKSAYNQLLGAQDPGGSDWCYYTFPNGRQVYTTFWRCCKSSGAMALEELPALACATNSAGDIFVNLYAPGRAAIETAAGRVRLEQRTDYPHDGVVHLDVGLERNAELAIFVRIPAWAEHASVSVNGETTRERPEPGKYLALRRRWQPRDTIALHFPMEPIVHTAASHSVQETKIPGGGQTSQEVMRYDYVALTRGPLCYATDRIDGYKIEETLRWKSGADAPRIDVADAPAGMEGHALRVHPAGRAPLVFLPYYEAGGRKDGAWRLTWMQVARD